MPNSSIDLHLHSHYSDGQASPAEIIRHAAEIGLKTISITDHDNLNGWQEAQFIASEVGLDLIPGIEFTARWEGCPKAEQSAGPGQNVDILAYFVNPQDTGLKALCDDLLADLRVRISECCKLMSAAGFPISIFDVSDENPHYPGASQLIRALCRRGHALDWNAAFELFARFWPQVRTSHFTVQEVIQAAHAAGGATVLAHPVVVRCDGYDLLSENDLQSFLEAGLDGLEIYHPILDSSTRQYFSKLAKQYELVVSGGSDEHGPEGGFSRMGSELVTYPMLAAIRQRAQKYGPGDNPG
jgi:predicted metal-dependent phosphoesterase TrpH